MSVPTEIAVTDAQVATLCAAAEAAFPHEACGLVVGHGLDRLTVDAIIPTTNTADDPARHFAVDPQIQFDILRRLRGTGQRVIGHYHSHPNGLATLSVHDLAMAHDPTAIWIVIPVGTDGRANTPAAFVCPAGAAIVLEMRTSPNLMD